MAIFSGLLIILSYWQFSGFEATVNSLATPSQLFCKSLLNFDSHHLVFYQAIACGTAIRTSKYDILKTISLWHIVIVSAGHFRVIQWVLAKSKLEKSWIYHPILLLFCFWTGAQAPVVRSYIELISNTTSKYLKLWIPSSYILLYSSCLGIILFPSWVSSWSFLLSWLCAILIAHLNKKSLLIQSIGISIGVYPIMCFFSPPHYLSFLFNFILGPTLSLLLFPATLLMVILPWLHFVTDPFLDFLIFIIPKLINNPEPVDLFFNSKLSQLTFGWIYILSLQFCLIFRHRKTNENFKI